MRCITRKLTTRLRDERRALRWRAQDFRIETRREPPFAALTGSTFMARFKTEREEENGWCRWVPPLMNGYRMACCDCGLVHDMEYRVVKVKRTRPDGTWEHGEPLDPAKYRVMFRAKRNNRSTGRLRKRKSNVRVSDSPAETST